ncbi:MAG: ABC transporter substrate-binding protein [Chloroflexota bacterium]
MSVSTATRRCFLGSLALAVVATPLAACGPSATASPTAQSGAAPAAQPTTATQPATQAQPTVPPQPTTAPAAGAKVPLSIAVRSDALFTWQTDAAKQFEQDHPNVSLTITQVNYNDMAKKQLAMLASGTMPDVIFSGAKWFSYSADKGAFLAIDDLVKSGSLGLDDFFKDAVASCKLDGKLYGLPYTLNTGNTNIIYYNKDLLAAKSLKEPTDDWTMDQFVGLATSLTDAPKHVYGTSLLPDSYYDLDTWARSLGGEILSADAKQFTLTTNPETKAAARWVTELRTKHHAAVSRADSQGIGFPAGQVALYCDATYDVGGIGKTIGNRFKWDVVLAPVGPGGLRGFEIFVSMFSLSAKTQHPTEAFDLLSAELSPKTALHAFVAQGLPPARPSIWQSADAAKISPIFGRVSKWLADGKDQGPFPMPDNLRFSELQDKFQNLIDQVFYGEVDFDSGLQNVQDACQKIVSLPRG